MKRISSILICAFFYLLPASAKAQSYFGSYDVPIPNVYGIQANARYFGHWSRLKTNSTPPETLMAELQGQYWMDRMAAVYVTLGYGLMFEESLHAGVGGKLVIITFAGHQKQALRSVTFYLNFDLIYYKTRKPFVPAEQFQGDSILFRPGGGLVFGVGRSGLFDFNLLFSRYSENFFISPSIGIGILFD